MSRDVRREARALAASRRARRRRQYRLGVPLLVLAIVVALIAGSSGSSPHPPKREAGGRLSRIETKIRITRVGSLAAPTQDAAAAAIDSKRLVLLGGLGASETSTDAVTVLAGGSVQGSSRLPQVQHDAQAATLAGAVYVFGGGDVQSYDHILRWEPTTGAATAVGHLPQPQSDVAVATIANTAYIVGGYNGQHPLDTIVAWSPGQPSRIVGHLPVALRYAAVAATGGRLIIAGGSEASEASDAIFSFDPASATVRSIGRLPHRLTHAAAAVLGSAVYVIGGRGATVNTPTSAIVSIDPSTGQAQHAGELPEAMSDEAAVAVGGSIVIAGGRTASGAQSAISEMRAAQVRVTIEDPRVAAARAAAQLAAQASSGAPSPAAAAAFAAASKLAGLPGYLLIADRGNNRILLVSSEHKIVWSFPTAADLAQGRNLVYNDDTFVAPGGASVVANEEDNHTIVSVDVATHGLHFLFGSPGVKGGGATHLNTPDDAYPLRDGSVVVADAYNCRILFIREHRIIRQYGTDGVCRHDPPRAFGAVNGDTPTPDGGLLVSEIPGAWVDSIGPHGHLRFSVHPPSVTYPSDPQPLSGERILLADYASPGQVLIINREGHILWRYRPTQGSARLDHPSLAFQLPNGDIAVNDDYRHRVVVIDPHTHHIVWQYGRTDEPGTGPNHLNTPDGMDFIPAAANGQPFWAAVHHP